MELFLIFGEVCTLGELANDIEKKLQPKYDKVYGTGAFGLRACSKAV